ncbi:hypothetical protein HHI36_014726 [Cryptolaemus montrouzieri]|uniref:Uncharacterized protein n=1 Tax=Cryptolaemus montrouzieri TaxID=559131 RepID=A0ABD2N3X1_9CUCU
MSSPKQSKSAIVHLLIANSSNNPRFVPPVLRDVGKLAASVASVNTTKESSGSATEVEESEKNNQKEWKNNGGLYNEANMRDAVELVKYVMKLRAATELKNVKYTTLHRYVQKNEAVADEVEIRINPNYRLLTEEGQ